jgi:transketolase
MNISNSKSFHNSEATAARLRVKILQMIHAAKSGHPGGSFSALEIIMTLFHSVLKYRSREPLWEDRDRFVLSKGHAIPALYAVLSEVGYFPEDWLLTLRQLGSPLQGHPDVFRMPAVEAATGSLGQGLSIAQGMALAQRLDRRSSRTFCLIGDGESQEGQIWETAMSAPKFRLNNLTVILDYNHGQIDGPTDEVMSLEPVLEKWRSFNWNVVEVDGHDQKKLAEILPVQDQERPTFILARTTKGRGVSFMESNISWHGAAPNDDQLAQALQELEK